MTLDRVEAYLADMRSLLARETPAAAEAIRALTGPIFIYQKPYPDGKRGAQWIAKFSPDFLRLLSKVARDKNYPDSITLEFLSSGNWIVLTEVEVIIDSIPKYQRLAPEIKREWDNGASVDAIASARGLSWEFVTQVLDYADTGERPKWKPSEVSGRDRPAPGRVRRSFPSTPSSSVDYGMRSG